MAKIIKYTAFWLFQIINTLTGFLMTFFPKSFHESLFANPEAVYTRLGFSSITVDMLHNVIRGHGATLLAVSIFLWTVGVKRRFVHLLIFLVCALSVYAHVMTMLQHLNTPEIMSAIGSLASLYVTIAITAFVGFLNAFVYVTDRSPK